MAGDELPLAPEIFIMLFILVFPLLWIAILGIIAAQGWRRVHAVYPSGLDPPPSVRRVRFGSLSLGGSIMSPTYSSCIDAWLSETGLWLRPILLFRPFHPMIFLPWARMQTIENERVTLFRRVRVKLAGNVPDLLLAGALGRAVLEVQPPLRPHR